MICSVRDESAERSATGQRPRRTDSGVAHRAHERLGDRRYALQRARALVRADVDSAIPLALVVTATPFHVALVIIPVFYAFAMGVDRPIVAEVRA